MSRRPPLELVAVALALLAFALALPVAAPAAERGTLTPGGAAFPERSFLLTLPPGSTPDASAIRVDENGRPVRDLRVSSGLAGDRAPLGVVLLIDTSESMRGAAIASAMRAARAYARQRPDGQPLGIVTFNERPVVLLAPTTDAQAIDAALARRPPLDPGTRLLDAARTSLGVLGKADVQAGAIVVLSDGSDRGSRTSAAQIARLAERDSVRVYTVGARSRSYEAATLQDLARATGGRYLGAASGPALVRLYRALGSELANSYVLRWRSQMPAGDRVRVVADAGGILARSSYVAPPVALATSGRPRAESFFATNAGIAVVAVSALLAVLLLFWALMGGRGGGHGVRERVADYGPEPLPALEGGPERGKAQSGRWAAFAELLDIGGIEASPGRIVLLTLAGGAAAALAVGVVTGSAVVAVLMLPVAALVAWALVRRAVTRRREAFAGQLADSLQAVASAMRAGHSFAGGLAVLCEEAPEPAASEFTRVIADERLGVPLEDAFESLRRRMDNRDVEQVALVAVLQRETGGNGAEALDRVVENLRGREDVRRLVKTLTAQGQLSRWVLTAIPAALLGLLALIAGDYVAPLFETTAGHVLLVLAGLLCVAGSLLIDRIVKIEV